jgi:hypothetical protein
LNVIAVRALAGGHPAAKNLSLFLDFQTALLGNAMFPPDISRFSEIFLKNLRISGISQNIFLNTHTRNIYIYIYIYTRNTSIPEIYLIYSKFMTIFWGPCEH